MWEPHRFQRLREFNNRNYETINKQQDKYGDAFFRPACSMDVRHLSFGICTNSY
jgi:hypothetical protein